MFSAHNIDWLDAMGSVSVEMDEESARLRLRGVPCRDMHHRGFDIAREGEDVVSLDLLGKAIGHYSAPDEALIESVLALGGPDMTAPPPRLKGIRPGAARCCRDWGLHVACFPTTPCVEREEVVQALADAVAANHLVAVQGFPGTGCHAVAIELARRMLAGETVSPELRHGRVMELDWLKLSASQTQSGALGTEERLAQVVQDLTCSGHVPVIPRGHVQELARVLPAGLRGVAFCTTPMEAALLATVSDVVHIVLPELSPHQVYAMLAQAAEALEVELGVTIPEATVDYIFDHATGVRTERPSPTVYQVAPGALVTLLRLACRRGLAMAGGRAREEGPPAITAATVEMSLLQFGASQDLLLHSLMDSIDSSAQTGGEATEGGNG